MARDSCGHFSPPWKDPLSPSSPGFITKSSAGLRARVLGQGPPDVVFLHGLGASLRYWGRAYDHLASHTRLMTVRPWPAVAKAMFTPSLVLACRMRGSMMALFYIEAYCRSGIRSQPWSLGLVWSSHTYLTRAADPEEIGQPSDVGGVDKGVGSRRRHIGSTHCPTGVALRR